MTLSTKPYKGARDFYPEDKQLHDYVFNKIRETVKKYGYQEYDAPIIEPLDLYKAKSGEEIINEQVYSFIDRGEREVAIRPEMTPSVSRMVAAKRQELSYPLRWFSIPNLWRYERPQRGRLREHWQLNVDVFGEDNVTADHEIIQIASNVLRDLGAKKTMFEIRVNHRGLMEVIFKKYFNLNQEQSHLLSKLIDRKSKIDQAVFKAEIDAICTPSQKDQGMQKRILKVLDVKTMQELPDEVKSIPEYNELVQLFLLLHNNNIENAIFDITIMRGLDYYTGIVFEVFDTDLENNRAMFGGGRYDGLIDMFGVEPLPTVGFGMGDVTLHNFLESHKLLPNIESDVDAVVILIGDVYARSQKFIDDLRDMGMNITVDASDRKIGSKIKSADKSGVKYAIFAGQKELDEEQFPLKNLVTGSEEKRSPARLVSIVIGSRG